MYPGGLQPRRTLHLTFLPMSNLDIKLEALL